jgi:osmotically-inducible protein OsmY
VRSAPRVAAGDLGDVLTEARLRRRLHRDRRTGADAIDVEVVDGRARLRGDVAPGSRAVATELARDAGGIDVVDNELREREAEPARG